MKKTKGSFGKKLCIWIIAIVTVTALAVGSSLLCFKTQLGEAAEYHRLLEQNEKEHGERYAREHNEKEAEDGAVLKQLTPVTSTQKAAVIGIGVFWLAAVVLYWLSVASLLAGAAEKAHFNRRIWFWLAFFTNIFAVVAFAIVKKILVKECPNCGNSQIGGAYCTECGAALNIKCPHCGKSLKPGEAYCPKCGEKVLGKEA